MCSFFFFYLKANFKSLQNSLVWPTKGLRSEKPNYSLKKMELLGIITEQILQKNINLHIWKKKCSMPELIYKSYNIWVCHSNLNNDLSKINTLHVCHIWSKNDNKEKLKKDKANFICRTDKISTEILWVMTHIKSWVLFLILNKIQCKYKWKIWTADELRKWWYLHTSYFVKKKVCPLLCIHWTFFVKAYCVLGLNW